MSRHTVIHITLAAVLTGALAGGCASPFHRTSRLDIQPIKTPAPAKPETAFAKATFYSLAVKAIQARDYGRALDLLQAAKAQKPDDVAVLNAFGVVYDKLGRLDLSARYYAQARALDPTSEIVRRNIAYSEQLHGRWSASPRSGELAARPDDVERVDVRPVTLATVAVKPPAAVSFTVASAPPPIPMIRTAQNGVLLMGRGLKIVDATGNADQAEHLRARLSHLGWSVSKTIVTGAQPQGVTTIFYPRQGVAVADALARSLPGSVKMAVCEPDCGQVVLTVGQDMAAHFRGANS